ncbi:hypothetical protein [Streptomyces sp. NPDC048392]|uniref:hypothetical protein n=1 Tax=Streptomyces sp. NPDC048392 TaxID=3365543 RepID=UPI00371182DE
MSPETMAAQPVLMAFLGTDDPRDAADRLGALVNELCAADEKRHCEDAPALRAAMAIGRPPLKNVTARRKAAAGELFHGSERSQFNAESRALTRLSFEIMDRYGQANVPDEADNTGAAPASKRQSHADVSLRGLVKKRIYDLLLRSEHTAWIVPGHMHSKEFVILIFTIPACFFSGAMLALWMHWIIYH